MDICFVCRCGQFWDASLSDLLWHHMEEHWKALSIALHKLLADTVWFKLEKAD